jgi:M3 family oligoendopeptidase
MKFQQFEYRRPDMEAITAVFEKLLRQFEQATDWATQDQIFDQLNELRGEFDSMWNICYIRHSVNTQDPFYTQENDFFNFEKPNFNALVNRFYKKMLRSPYRDQLEEKWGRHLFVLAELSLKSFDPVALEEMQEENRLSSEYMKLKAKAQIEFRGETLNLSSIIKHELAQERDTRSTASRAKWGFFAEHQAEIEELFDQLVKVRHRMAQKLGFKNFIELAYARLSRSDYDAEMVAAYREQIRTHLVPLASELYERQRRRLGLERLFQYDEEVRFLSGNAKPKGDTAWIIGNAQQMYAELSPETHAFFTLLRENDLMDLEAKPGKATGGYCTYVSKYQAPYIFSNFNGTSGDVEVLTHEAGHAFQVFSSRHFSMNEYLWPSYESAEIHSMSMEFFTWKWMHLFFGEETEKFKFSHVSGAISFLPYGVAIDEFQHRVYENPDLTPAQRNAVWKEIEQKYLPHRAYDNNPFLENGGFWQRQNHIFAAPFYYIDYTLAQVCAFQFWKRDLEDHASAWQDYLRLCETGGSRSFLELVRMAHLRSPFEPGCVESVVNTIRQWLAQVDDTVF